MTATDHRSTRVAVEARVRDASRKDAAAIASIGRAAMSAQYAALVDPAAVGAAVDQTYSEDAIADCIHRCLHDEDACFLVAERSKTVVGFLHYDCFGPEPELHRLYLDADQRGSGLGTWLMQELHGRIPPDLQYMLLVVAGNDRAIRFYQRHGVHVEGLVDGLTTYRDRMGVTFPPESLPFDFVVMRRQRATHALGATPNDAEPSARA